MVTIAIIEDDIIINQMYRMKFESSGFNVISSNDGMTGLQMLEKKHPDIILLDLQMPNMNGAEVLSEIRNKKWGKNIPVIVLTNLGKEEAPKELEKLNISSYIVKAELTPREVTERVKETLCVK